MGELFRISEARMIAIDIRLELQYHNESANRCQALTRYSTRWDQAEYCEADREFGTPMCEAHNGPDWIS